MCVFFVGAFTPHPIGLILFCGMTIYFLSPIIFNLLKPIARDAVIMRNQAKLMPFIEKADIAKSTLKTINQEYKSAWEAVCETHESYPPDWKDRREKVLSRDGYECSVCGYPNGFKRKSRDLHVHHIIPLYKGGTNSLNNLTTLCHVCHRNVDKKHSRIRKNKKRKR